MEFSKDASRRELARLESERASFQHKSVAARSAATAEARDKGVEQRGRRWIAAKKKEVVATVAAVHRNDREKQDLREA